MQINITKNLTLPHYFLISCAFSNLIPLLLEYSRTLSLKSKFRSIFLPITIARGFTKKSNFLPFSPSSNSEKSENSLHSASLLYGILSFVKQENKNFKYSGSELSSKLYSFDVNHISFWSYVKI